jgi:hypothetical protein
VYILEDLGIENVGIFYAIGYIMWSFGILWGNLVCIFHFGVLYVPRKIWHKWSSVHISRTNAQAVVRTRIPAPAAAALAGCQKD